MRPDNLQQVRRFERRLAKHEAGQGAKYTRGRGPFVTEVVSKPWSKSFALRLEAFVKQLPRSQKIPYLKTFA